MQGAGPWSPPMASRAIFIIVTSSQDWLETRVNNRWHLQRYEMRRELSAVRQFSQRTGRWRDPAALGGAPAAAGRARRETAHSDFFHLNDGLAFVRPAIETGIMRELQFMTLGAHRHARWGD